MDINFPTDPIKPPFVASRVPDLLAQLRAAGTIEAEVIRLLPGQLLLASRLGKILTRNTLDYKPGDRINLRLDESASYPVLKTSPAPRESINLDSRQNPELARALPPGRPTLAIVTRVSANQAEIQLAGQILKLPRPAGLIKNQLLGLRRIDSRRSIEVTPLERKSIYKAVLQQLLPKQAQNEASSLTRLMDLVGRTLAAARPSADPGSAPRDNDAVRTGANLTRVTQPGSAAGNPAADAQRAQYPAAGASASLAVAAARTPPQIDPGSKRYGQQSRGLPGDELAPLPQHANAERNVAEGKSHRKLTNAGLQPLPTSKPALTSGSHGGAATPAPGAGKTDAPATDRPAPAVTSASPDAPRHQAAEYSDKSGTRPTPPDSEAPRAQVAAIRRGANGGDTLWTLLQLVTRFAEIDASRLKRWFEFAGLVRYSGSEPADAKPIPASVLLKRLADPEGFARELLRSIQGGDGKPRDPDAGRQPTAESMLPQIREGVKLVEQSLAHNLMQRASLGLQQETQQPLVLSLALPLLEAHQVKPLHIELAQRNRAQREADRGWDVRLSFDFAGLGPVSCHIVVEGLAIGASFYCEREPTRQRIDAALPQLRQRFCSAGFNPGDFHCFPGRAAPGPAPSAADFSELLIDIEV